MSDEPGKPMQCENCGGEFTEEQWRKRMVWFALAVKVFGALFCAALIVLAIYYKGRGDGYRMGQADGILYSDGQWEKAFRNRVERDTRETKEKCDAAMMSYADRCVKAIRSVAMHVPTDKKD